jgi:type II secretory pathway pseudopilin PulG
MAALLVAMAVMAVLMSVALPVWKHDARRAKEAELVWRGQQYVRAIRLYSAHMGGALPPSIDALVTGRYLRRKYKDPITNDDFQVLGAGSPIPGQSGDNSGRGGTIGSMAQPSGGSTIGTGQAPVLGAIIGVVSKSKDESIRLYQGRNHYNEWTFLYVNQQPTAPLGPGGQPVRGGRGGPDAGGPGRGRGGRGRGFSDGRGFGGRGFGSPGFGPAAPGGPGGPGGPPIRRGGGVL